MKEEQIFHQALELVADRRAAYLDEACGQDASLRQRVDVLLQTHANPGSFLAAAAHTVSVDLALVQLPPERSGTQIGPYKLLQKIGEGGMGEVYMAEQTEPIARRVAVKIIKPGMDTRQVIARFEAERQALALMDHPNIAKVLDAGTTGEVPETRNQEPGARIQVDSSLAPGTRLLTPTAGRPYFVMELVRGIPITQYCDEHHLSLRQRLELFVTVCQAIQHAHQKGIIHRDIKPTNVLVAEYDEQAVAKIIDFGVAKAVGARLTDKTMFTEFGQLIGTLEYMSPEQAKLNQLDIDTRSDIYSLGVLLYELLTGTTPLDRKRLQNTSLLELLRIVREQEAPTLSNRLNTTKELPAIAASRGLEPAKLTKLLRGELNWIVTKALEKDRNRRYETASALAADVQRYLTDEPVEACPPSAWYRFRKFARRNSRALVTAAVVILAVLLTAAGSGGFIWRANQDLSQALDRERDTQRRERRKSYSERVALASRELTANNLSRMDALLDECPSDLRGWEWHYLKRLRYGSQRLLRHENPVHSVAFSHDGQYLASATQAGKVRLWQLRNERRLQEWQAHRESVTGVVFSSDGQYLASGSWDGMVKVWELEKLLEDETEGETEAPLHQFELSSRVWCVAFSPDGRRLAAASGRTIEDHGEAKVWDLKSRREALSLSFPSRVTCVQFSPNGLSLATVCETLLQVWNAQNGQKELESRDPAGSLQWVSFSPDGRRLATVGGLISVHPDREIKIWDAQTGQELRSLAGHVGGLRNAVFSPDGRRLASAGLDQTIKLWDTATWTETVALNGHLDNIWGLAFRADGQKLASASVDNTVRIWDASPPESTKQEHLTLQGHRGAVTDVAFHPTDGRRLVSAGTDGTVRVWDLWSGKETRVLDMPPSTMRVRAAFSPDGQTLAALSARPRQVSSKIWDAFSFQEIRSLGGQTIPDQGLAFSPDSRHLASAGLEYVIRIWDTTTDQEPQILKAHRWPVTDVVFHPSDAGQIVSGSADGTVRVWDWTTGQESIALEPRHTARVQSVAFSRDGKQLATASCDRTIKIWDCATWKLEHELADPTGAVLAVIFGPDRRLVWGSSDGTVKVWDGPGTETHVLRGHASWLQAVAISPDDQWIASASLDGTVKIWQQPPKLMAMAQGSEDSKQ